MPNGDINDIGFEYIANVPFDILVLLKPKNNTLI